MACEDRAIEGVKSSFLPRLVNGPFGDPGVYVALRWHGVAVQFDLGSLDRFPAALLLRLRHIFVSHTHLDHFIGFDRVLRLFLNRDATLELYGPPGIIHNVRGKLAGYTWNLVDGYRFALVVHEVFTDHIETVHLPATTAFRPERESTRGFERILMQEPNFHVEAVHLDHRIPSLAFALVEPTHLNVKPDALDRLSLAPGPWLNRLKQALRAGAPLDTTIEVAGPGSGGAAVQRFSLDDLQRELVVVTPGQRLAYVVDTLFSHGNVERIVELAAGADVLYCESLFVDADRDEARKRCHLTARQAGTLARLAKVKQLRTFHFSPRYAGDAAPLRAEAEAAFRGEMPPDVPD